MLKGSIKLLHGLLQKHRSKTLKFSFELIREFPNQSFYSHEQAQEIEEIEYLDQPSIDNRDERLGSIVHSGVWEDIPMEAPMVSHHQHQFDDYHLVPGSTFKIQILLRNVSRALKCQS